MRRSFFNKIIKQKTIPLKRFAFKGLLLSGLIINSVGCKKSTGTQSTNNTPFEVNRVNFANVEDSLKTIQNLFLANQDSIKKKKLQWIETDGIIVTQLGETCLNIIAKDSALFAQYKLLVMEEFPTLESVHNELTYLWGIRLTELQYWQKQITINPPNNSEKQFQWQTKMEELKEIAERETQTMHKIKQWEKAIRLWLNLAQQRCVTRPPVFNSTQNISPATARKD